MRSELNISRWRLNSVLLTDVALDCPGRRANKPPHYHGAGCLDAGNWQALSNSPHSSVDRSYRQLGSVTSVVRCSEPVDRTSGRVAAWATNQAWLLKHIIFDRRLGRLHVFTCPRLICVWSVRVVVTQMLPVYDLQIFISGIVYN